MDGLDASVFSGGGLFLVCSSTYGQGDVPDNAKNLYESLQTARPDLSGVQYGVIALGDRTYAETFCNGGRRFDAILAELGARRIGEIMLHDASAGTMPEEVGRVDRRLGRAVPGQGSRSCGVRSASSFKRAASNLFAPFKGRLQKSILPFKGRLQKSIPLPSRGGFRIHSLPFKGRARVRDGVG